MMMMMMFVCRHGVGLLRHREGDDVHGGRHAVDPDDGGHRRAHRVLRAGLPLPLPPHLPPRPMLPQAQKVGVGRRGGGGAGGKGGRGGGPPIEE